MALIVKSTFTTSPSAATGVRVIPGSTSGSAGMFCSTKRIWKKGVWARFRPGDSSSTSFSNGRS